MRSAAPSRCATRDPAFRGRSCPACSSRSSRQRTAPPGSASRFPRASWSGSAAGSRPSIAARAAPCSASSCRPRSGLAPALRQVLRAHQDFARLGAVTGAEDAVLLHHVDEARRFGIAEAHTALQKRDRALPLADDELYGVPVQVVAVRGVATLAAPRLGRQDDLLVDGRALRAQELAARLHLVVG